MKPTYAQIATDYRLWGEYIDPSNTMTESEFDAMPATERIEAIVACLGPEDRLGVALDAILDHAAVAHAAIWYPDGQEIAELEADGVPVPEAGRLEVTVWRSHRNPSDIRCEVEALGLVCVGQGDSELGPCYSFAEPTI